MKKKQKESLRMIIEKLRNALYDDDFKEKEIADYLKEIRHGLFSWRSDGIYHHSKALKTYKSKVVAEKVCRKLFDSGENTSLVVRTIYPDYTEYHTKF